MRFACSTPRAAKACRAISTSRTIRSKGLLPPRTCKPALLLLGPQIFLQRRDLFGGDSRGRFAQHRQEPVHFVGLEGMPDVALAGLRGIDDDLVLAIQKR